jgi:hypothetical protein
MSKKFSTRGAVATENLPIPATGEVSQFEDTECSITVTNASGTTKQLATVQTANIKIGGDKKLPKPSKRASSTTVNDTDIFLADIDVVDDTDIGPGANQSLNYSEA